MGATVIISNHLTASQKQAILTRDYWLDDNHLVTADDGHNRCPLAVAAGVIYTPKERELAHLLGVPEGAVRQFVAAADHGKIRSHEELSAALGVSHEP